ncbi:uncharacterized protein LOC121405899 [Lytechinus variegatus]|uniref:uncharacterized protein LOC121405899 n=1 Tax=Lytechinus variegatus TaxID=7654 RepID=UPI001BB2497A|nr:uncharacterized protein LOC121405899 [Lytechinus variegatus]
MTSSPSYHRDPPMSSSTRHSPSLRQRVRRRWGLVVVVATFALYFMLYGILFSYNVLFVAFQQEFNSSATMTGWVGSIPLSISLMFAPLIKMASERFGYRSVSVFGILMVSAGIFVTSFLPSLLPMFGTYGLMSGIGAGVVTVCAFDLIVLYFPEKNTMRAVAIAVTGSTAGMLSLTQVMDLTIREFGWRITLRIMGAFLFAVGLPCVLTYTLPVDQQENNRKNKYCKVIFKPDDTTLSEAVADLEKCPLNFPYHSKMEVESNKIFISGSPPAYRVVDGLGEDTPSWPLGEQHVDAITEGSVSDRSVNVCSDSEPEVEESESPENRYHQLTTNCNVSSQTPWSGNESGDGENDTVDAIRVINTSNGIWQSDDDSPATIARRYPISNHQRPTLSVVVHDGSAFHPEKPLENLPRRGMLRKICTTLTFPEIWMISVATILNGIGDCFYYVNAISYLVSIGFEEQIGVQFVSFTAVSNFVFKVALVFIGEYLPFPRIFIQVISNVISIIVWILLMVLRSVIPIYCTAVVAGITLAITNVVTFSLAPDFFGQERAMETSSVIFFSYGTGYLLGSLVGQSIDNTGSYKGAIWAFIGMYVTSGILLLLAPLYQRIFAPERFVTFDLHRKKRDERRERNRLRKRDRHRCKVSNGDIIVCEQVSTV